MEGTLGIGMLLTVIVPWQLAMSAKTRAAAIRTCTRVVVRGTGDRQGRVVGTTCAPH